MCSLCRALLYSLLSLRLYQRMQRVRRFLWCATCDIGEVYNKKRNCVAQIVLRHCNTCDER